MSERQVTLATAAFMDSPEAQALEAPGPEDVRKIVERFLEVCYDGIGVEPRLMDGHDVHGALGHLLPARFKRKDPLAEHVPAVLRQYIRHLTESQVVPQAFELQRGFESTVDEFLETVRTGENSHHHVHKKQAPVVHQAPKLGRNDPCFCGSGKKFKKCCGSR